MTVYIPGYKPDHVFSEPVNPESPVQYENRIKLLVYVRRVAHSTTYEKSPF